MRARGADARGTAARGKAARLQDLAIPGSTPAILVFPLADFNLGLHILAETSAFKPLEVGLVMSEVRLKYWRKYYIRSTAVEHCYENEMMCRTRKEIRD